MTQADREAVLAAVTMIDGKLPFLIDLTAYQLKELLEIAKTGVERTIKANKKSAINQINQQLEWLEIESKAGE